MMSIVLKTSFLAGVFAILAAGLLPAQPADPLSFEVKRSYSEVKHYLQTMAEMMPAEDYGFRPVPDVETFGRRVAHIADANYRSCTALQGDPKTLGAASKTAKADLVTLLQRSFDACDAVFNALTDATALQLVDGGIGSPPRRGERNTRLSVLYNVVRHSNEMYGYMSVYLRLKGLVPPSSEGRR